MYTDKTNRCAGHNWIGLGACPHCLKRCVQHNYVGHDECPYCTELNNEVETVAAAMQGKIEVSPTVRELLAALLERLDRTNELLEQLTRRQS